MEQKVKKEKSEESELYIPSQDEATIYANSVGIGGEFRERERESCLSILTLGVNHPEEGLSHSLLTLFGSPFLCPSRVLSLHRDRANLRQKLEREREVRK